MRFRCALQSTTAKPHSPKQLVSLDFCPRPHWSARCYKTVLKDGVEVPAVRTMMCMEVNDMNPLEVTSYTLKNSGKMYYDAVMLFAANINYNEETGRVYVNCNENVSAILLTATTTCSPCKIAASKFIFRFLAITTAQTLTTLPMRPPATTLRK